MKTTSLEISKLLKEAGYQQEDAEYCWYEVFKDDEYRVERFDSQLAKSNIEYSTLTFASPTADEILDQLPIPLVHGGRNLEMFIDVFQGLYLVGYADYYSDDKPYKDTMADACAELWLYLKKEGLI